MIVALTLDVDCQSYAGGSPRAMGDELEVALAVLEPVFGRHPEWRATWFLRIDPDLDLFARQARRLKRLLEAGHGIGWHYHGPLRRIADFARSARRRGMATSRVGFGRGSNHVMRTLANAGFEVDSTAMPRPTYHWTRRGVDWTTTPHEPYHPSAVDYRVPGTPSLPILEVPISCAVVAAPGDNQEVVRYINPAYRPEIFHTSLGRWLPRQAQVVTITHPYEVCAGPDHALLAFDVKAFEENVTTIARSARRVEFVTLADIAERSRLEMASA